MKIMKISEFKEIFNSACTEEQRNERGKNEKRKQKRKQSLRWSNWVDVNLVDISAVLFNVFFFPFSHRNISISLLIIIVISYSLIKFCKLAALQK